MAGEVGAQKSCCMCGGGCKNKVLATGDDAGGDWMDKFGNTCAAYDALGFCHAGKVLAKATAFDLENGWNRPSEMGGSKACCACGGGEAIDRRPTDAHGAANRVWSVM